MGYCVEFMVLKLVIWADIDVCTFVFGAVAVFRCGEDCALY